MSPRYPAVLKTAATWWLLLCVAAFAAGTGRVVFLEPHVGELTAHQIGTVVLCAIITGAAYYVVTSANFTPTAALLLGTTWLLLTVAFEFGFFHYAMAVPWEQLLGDYNIAERRIWPLVLATDLLAPWLIAVRWHRKPNHG